MYRQLALTSPVRFLTAAVLAATLVAVLVVPSFAQAATLTLTASETTPNSTIKSVPAITTAGGVTEVKATRTITVDTVPANAVTLTIGTCVVTFGTAASQELSCSDNVAAVNTTTDATAAAVAARLRSLTNVSDTGHGALTVGGSGSTASFTTTGTESAATVITASLSSGSSITLTTVNTTGVIPVAATVTIVITGALPAVSADQTLNIDADLGVALGASALTAAEVADAIRTQVTADPQYAGKNYAVTGAGANIIFTRESAGAAGNGAITITEGDYGSKAQVVTFTTADTSPSKVFTITINDNDYSVEDVDSAQDMVESLVELLAAETAITCTEDNVVITCTADVAGTAFTYATAVTDREDSGGGGGGGGGGSSNNNDDDEDEDEDEDSNDDSNSDSDTVTVESILAKIAQIRAALAEMNGGTTTVAVEASADLDLESEGPQVVSLQTWLIAKGYAIPAGATGYFGAQTQAALAAYQAANGITPAAGYYGPKTRAFMQANP